MRRVARVLLISFTPLLRRCYIHAAAAAAAYCSASHMLLDMRVIAIRACLIRRALSAAIRYAAIRVALLYDADNTRYAMPRYYACVAAADYAAAAFRH